MPHRLLLLLCLLAPPLMAADASEEHDLAYSLGAR
ncbi:MAG: FKBP-type peptidyl-prolyl cis-trans isomerase, partial [Pseudomonas sp.]|nr:FKBP-type peptidyl-prolyl cis-trans isomerase [Pseudomonas sp.]